MNAAIEVLKKSLGMEQRRLGYYQRDLERTEEKRPIVKQNIQDTESKIQDIEASIFVLKQMAEG